ncbi:MAG: hypothetical protein QE273_10605 [Verrucomicrobiales bacterium]|nr:hypothetical protein [Verrucomicrobiales bacterium]
MTPGFGAPRLSKCLFLTILFILTSLSPAFSRAQAPAFPGAEGFGAEATGGRGGRVIFVTTTATSGPGSLQNALDQTGPRYVVFTASGTIDAQIHLAHGDVTIAGETSPGGITIRGFVTDETPFQDQTVEAPAQFAENWILRHVRIRPGAGGPSDDGLRLRYTRNAIIDHVSVGNAEDEAVEISYSNRLTVQNSLLAETVGGHSFYGGMLMNYSNPAHGFALDRLSIHHNLFVRIEGRLPEASRESAAAAGSTMDLELSNNLYWDPRFFIALGADTNVVTNGLGQPYPIHYRLNAVGNVFRTGPAFPYGMWDDQILRAPSAGGNELFVSGNTMSLHPGRADYELFYCCNDYPGGTLPDATSRSATARTIRHSFPAITYTATASLRESLLENAGAFPRDPMDQRLVAPVEEERIDSAAPNTNPAGDHLLPAYTGGAPAAPTDSDHDGMPDAWETARGLDPQTPDHAGRDLSTAGYDNLEIYLHELAAERVGSTPPTGGGTVAAPRIVAYRPARIVLRGNQSRVTLSGTATGRAAIARIEAKTGPRPSRILSTSADWRLRVSLPSPGRVPVEIRATDRDGRVSAPFVHTLVRRRN